VSRVTLETAVAHIASWIAGAQSRYVCICDVHSLMLARSDVSHAISLACADMVTPDGQPIAWTLRQRGYTDIARTCGPDLLPAVCARSVREGWTHYFYGGAEGVAGELARRMAEQYPGLNIAGTECPPFRQLNPEERMAVIERIRASGANIVWVGLGCPKQERWMHEHRPLLPGVVMIGIGAAFDFHTGRIERAPEWMRSNGLEWLHRLTSEPRRLWRRYLILAPRFLLASVAETLSLAWRNRGKKPPED
jgi:N-acetylglucosaminyldiphosphoundecaprenol N-acetyl-beta-D-mannosaminyltransferase